MGAGARPAASAPAPDLIVYADGASRSNPGPAAIGVVVQAPDGADLEAVGELIGVATNNEAEYRAVLKGLQLAAAHKGRRIEVRSDSELTIKQLNGSYRTQKPQLIALQAEVRAAQTAFAEVRFRWVPREEAGSQRADALANAELIAAGHPKKEWDGARRR